MVDNVTASVAKDKMIRPCGCSAYLPIASLLVHDPKPGHTRAGLVLWGRMVARKYSCGDPEPIPVARGVINTMFAIEECMWTSVPVHGGPSLDHCQHDGHH